MIECAFSCPIGFLFNFIELRSVYSWTYSIVIFNGCVSRKIDVLSDVPQGSNLGSFRFLLFINDLRICIKNSTVVMFAHVKPFKVGSDILLLQDDLIELSN